MKDPFVTANPVPSTAGLAEPVGPLLTIEWRQDRRLRTMAVSGALSSVDYSHLSSGLVQLGNRGLVIDLTGLDVWDVDAVGSIVEVVGRLGTRSARVVVSDSHLGALLKARLAATVEVEVAQTSHDSGLPDPRAGLTK